MNCPKCGAHLVRGEQACWQCHAPVAAPPLPSQPGAAAPVVASPAPPRPQSKTQPQPKTRLTPVLAIVAVLALGGVGFRYWSWYPGPGQIASRFVVALRENDYETATKYATADSYIYRAPTNNANPVNEIKVTAKVKYVRREGDRTVATLSVTTHRVGEERQIKGMLEDAYGRGVHPGSRVKLPDGRQVVLYRNYRPYYTNDEDFVVVHTTSGWRVDMNASQEWQRRHLPTGRWVTGPDGKRYWLGRARPR